MTAASALPCRGYGDVVMTQHFDPETRSYSITVERADPRVLIGGHLLVMLTTPDSGDSPAWQHNATLDPGNGPGLYEDCVLRIHAADCTLIYRITGRHDEHTWIGEWPD